MNNPVLSLIPVLSSLSLECLVLFVVFLGAGSPDARVHLESSCRGSVPSILAPAA